ncbi:alkyl hydroperoxide reductase subunit AhpC [Paraburkholderia sp. GAS199]|uniref:redoxin domain-containing protein n=1 Tax=Paraburkholderia sp. GAS199 TaxID=3035126 RepID=UPI003D25C26F
MTLSVGSVLPEFEAVSSQGPLNFSDWLGDGWALVFAFKAMSPTCSTEFAALEQLHAEFERCGARVLGVSVDQPDMVSAWLGDLREMLECTPSFALINDPTGEIPALLGLLDPHASQVSLLRSAHLIAPDRRIAMTLTYPVTNGRSFSEILRTLKAVQLTANKRVATSSTWNDGDPVMLPPSLAQDKAEQMYPAGVQVLRPYLRIVAQP